MVKCENCDEEHENCQCHDGQPNMYEVISERIKLGEIETEFLEVPK